MRILIQVPIIIKKIVKEHKEVLDQVAVEPEEDRILDQEVDLIINSHQYLTRWQWEACVAYLVCQVAKEVK